METETLKNLYQKAFNGVEDGFSYEQMSKFTGIPEQLLRLQHIRKCRQDENYEKQIKFYTLKLIKNYGMKILSTKKINNLSQIVPYRFRSSVKHLIYNLKERKSNALSRVFD